MKVQNCPECGCNEIGTGKWDGFAVIHPAHRILSKGSKVFAEVCTNCGLVVALRVEKPEKFKQK